MGKYETLIPDFNNSGEDESVKWLSIVIWVLGIVIELIKRIKNEQGIK
jgi:hypothetical protein